MTMPPIRQHQPQGVRLTPVTQVLLQRRLVVLVLELFRHHHRTSRSNNKILFLIRTLVIINIPQNNRPHLLPPHLDKYLHPLRRVYIKHLKLLLLNPHLSRSNTILLLINRQVNPNPSIRSRHPLHRMEGRFIMGRRRLQVHHIPGQTRTPVRDAHLDIPLHRPHTHL